MKIDLSVVIPIYNEQASLDKLFSRLYPALDALGLAYEIIFINDGSRDRSATILADQFRLRPDVTRVVLFNGNYGQHMAILAGFAETRGEITVTLDAVLPFAPDRADVIEAFAHLGHQVADFFRRILQVGVQRHGDLATGLGETGQDRHVLAVVAVE